MSYTAVFSFSDTKWVALTVFFMLVFVAIFMILLLKLSKRNTKGAFVFLAIFPLLSLFPIPPSATESLDKQKREQVKRKEDSGDPLT